MSRNSSRKSAPADIPQPTPQAAPPGQSMQNPLHQQMQAAFGINLVSATEMVEIPSKGKFYDPSSTLSGREFIEIKQMTAREEDILSNQQFMLDGTIFDRLLSSIIVDKSIRVEELMSGDRNAILFAARISGYGPEYVMKLPCPKCSKVSEFAFDLEKTSATHVIPEGVTFLESEGLFEFTLPMSELSVKVRVLTGADEQYLTQQKENAEKLGLDNNHTINMLRRAVVEARGVTDPAILNQLFDVLPAIDSRKIRSVVNSVIPGVETKQSVACGSCEKSTEMEVPVTMGFFWPDV